MLSDRHNSITFASATTQITPPNIFTHSPAVSVSEQALKLARFAYVRSQGGASAPRTQDDIPSTSIIQTVAKAIERAFRDEKFALLSFEQQEIAAARLTSQCIGGMRVAYAIQGALMNPFTLATQLKNNAFFPHDGHNVFDHIIAAHHPANTVAAMAASEVDALPSPAGRA